MSVVFWVSASYSAEPSKIEVAGQGFVADFYCSDNSSNKVGILVLGGAEGGKPNYLAKIFAENGYPVLSLTILRRREHIRPLI